MFLQCDENSLIPLRLIQEIERIAIEERVTDDETKTVYCIRTWFQRANRDVLASRTVKFKSEEERDEIWKDLCRLLAKPLSCEHMLAPVHGVEGFVYSQCVLCGHKP